MTDNDLRRPLPVVKATYTISEAAKILGVSRNNAYEAVKAGKLPAIHIGRRVLVPRASLAALLGKSNADVTADEDEVVYWKDRAERAEAELTRLRKLIRVLGEDDPMPVPDNSRSRR